jgi:hypothetical protein
MKTCSNCQQEKQPAEFWPDRRRSGGLQARCKTCRAASAKDWRDANKHKAAERYWSNPDAERERHLVRKYGVTLERYRSMLEQQGGACAICRKTQQRAFDVDHCHATGRVRGLLCTNCNRMIGHAADDAARLRAAASYLESIVPQVAAEFIRATQENS